MKENLTNMGRVGKLEGGVKGKEEKKQGKGREGGREIS